MSTKEWDFVQFANAPIEIIDGDRGNNYPCQGEFFEKGDCLFLNAGNVTKTGFNFEQKMFITKEKDKLLRKGKLQRNDFVLTTRGTVGNVAHYVHSINFENVRINSGMVIFRINDDSKIDGKFFYQYLKSDIFKNQIKGYSTGSAQPQLPIRDINRIEIPLPPLPEQSAIADVLSALDDKIELNRQMNKTLEQLAHIIFLHYFMDNSKPNNWEIRKVGDICSFEYGKPMKATDRVIGSIPVYGSNGQIGMHDEFLVEGPGIVVGRKGNPGTVTYVHTNFYPIDTTFYVVPVSKINIYWLYYSLQNLNLPNLNADSAVPGLNRNIAYMSELSIPPSEITESFEDQIKPIFAKMFCNDSENNALSELRDTLLPKLMSGKVRVQS